jgi:hypothetical protein
MSWIWLNIPLGVLVVLAIAGIPMWLVVKHPDARPDLAAAARPDLAAAALPSRDRAHARTPAARIPLRAGTR